MDRDEFARQFIQKGKASGASKDEVKMRLQVALNDYDSKFGSDSGLGSEPSLVESFGRAIVQPAIDYTKLLATPIQSNIEAATGVDIRKTPVIGPLMGMSDEDIITYAGDTETKLKRGVPEAIKRASGAASYIPSGSLPKAVGAGAMYGLSQVDDDAAVDQYVKDVVTGGAGGALGYGAFKLGGALLGKLTEKVGKIMRSSPEIPEDIADKAAQHIIQKASKARPSDLPGVSESVYQSGFPFSKKGNAFERLQPQKVVKTMIHDGVWGTPAQISKKVDLVTGDSGVLSNVVNTSLKEMGTIDVPAGLIDANDITGKYTLLNGDDVNGLMTRLGKAAPGSTVVGKDAQGLFKFQKDLEREAYDVLSRNSSSGKVVEFAKLQLELAQKIEGVIDDAISESGISSALAKDPAIIAFLDKNVSRNLARRFAESGGDLRVLRSLQKDYYRMGQMIKLSSQEGSSLGKSNFKWIDQVLGVGPALSALSKQVEAVVGTGIPVAASKISGGISGAGQAAGAVARGVSNVAGNVAGRVAPITGAVGLGQVPPRL